MAIDSRRESEVTLALVLPLLFLPPNVETTIDTQVSQALTGTLLQDVPEDGGALPDINAYGIPLMVVND